MGFLSEIFGDISWDSKWDFHGQNRTFMGIDDELMRISQQEWSCADILVIFYRLLKIAPFLFGDVFYDLPTKNGDVL